MDTPYDQLDQQRVCALWQRGNEVLDIAFTLKTSPLTIARILRENGVRP
jgi:hypothetical protein